MTPTPLQAKTDLRRRMKAVLAAVPPAELAAASRTVVLQVLASPRFAAANTVMLFHPMPGEIDLGPLAAECWARGKAVCLPRVDWTGKEMQAARVAVWGSGLTESRPGVWGPKDDAEVVPAATLDWIAVPGLSFDSRGGRLGRGAGFYDRFLTGLPAYKAGIALDQQIVAEVVCEPWDVRLDAVVTPTRWIDCR